MMSLFRTNIENNCFHPYFREFSRHVDLQHHKANKPQQQNKKHQGMARSSIKL